MNMKMNHIYTKDYSNCLLQTRVNNYAIATVILVKDILNLLGARITFDSAVEKEMYVEYKGKFYVFWQMENGMYTYRDNSDVKLKRVKACQS